MLHLIRRISAFCSGEPLGALLLVFMVAAGGAGCTIRIDYEGTFYRCNQDNLCPPGYQCTEGSCRVDDTPDGRDAGASDAGASDAGPSDAPSCGTTDLLVDDFASGAIERTEWAPWTASGAMLREQDGELIIETLADTADTGAGVRSQTYYRLRSSQLVVEMASPDAGFEEAWTVALEGSDVSHSWGVRNSQVTFTSELDNVKLQQKITHLPAEQRFWQLREQDGMIYGSLSADGVTWTTVGMAPHATDDRPLQLHMFQWIVGPEPVPHAMRILGVNAGLASDVSWCPFSSLIDEFDTNIIDERRWRTWRSGGCNVVAANDQLALVPNPIGYSRCGITSHQKHDLRASTVAVEIPNVGSPSVSSYLEAKDDGVIVFRFQHENGTLYAAVEDETTGTVTTLAEPPYNAGQHRWWRLRGDSGLLHWETSADGRQWQALASHPVTNRELSALKAKVWAEARDPGDAATSAHFDSLNGPL